MIECWYPVGRFRVSTIASLERPDAIVEQTPQLPWLPLLRLVRLVRSATNESQQRQPAANGTHLALGEALHQTDQKGWPGHALRGGAVLARSRPRYGYVPRLKAPNEASGALCLRMVYPKLAPIAYGASSLASTNDMLSGQTCRPSSQSRRSPIGTHTASTISLSEKSNGPSQRA